ncbi:M48 family metallopeptidase [Pseudoalteromonas luteoviolacea]|uniref:M48 family metallopeptidase n=1 Tax=Pseudoalteromonas luteoviolacea TaxID=43657 RepID=UPI001B35FB7D|nr:YgjP-like metallopeptidase domain-containing protein [Pseudoalteromonas luteoviolacea]MBQ4835302.1 DUF45 domain-containing protein [Pseudoalteromonas luteoviolacea]
MNFNYQLKLSRRRKTVAIKVKPDGVVVYAPEGICENWLTAWLHSKQSWVAQKQRLVADTLPCKKTPLEKVTIFGDCYVVCYGHSSAYIDHQHHRIYIKSSMQQHRDIHIGEIYDLFKVELIAYLHARLPYYQALMGSKYKTLKVRFYKRRWGSLSSKGVLAFNSALLSAPKWVIDYVIVHELAHYHVMAHNHAFWCIVGRFYPEFETAKAYLKQEIKLIH